MNLDFHSQGLELDTCTNIFDFQRLMDLSDTNLLNDWKRGSRIQLHPEGGVRTKVKRIGLWHEINRGMDLPFPWWYRKTCKRLGLGFNFFWMVTRNSWFTCGWFVSRVRWGNHFGDLLSFARMIAFSAAPAGACIHWVLPRTVDSWDLKIWDIFEAYIEVEKGFMRLVTVAFEAAWKERPKSRTEKGTQADAQKQHEISVQRNVQSKAEAKSEATGKGEGDAPADAQKQQERYVQRDVQSNAEAKDHAESQSKAEVKTKVEGSHREGKRWWVKPPSP